MPSCRKECFGQFSGECGTVAYIWTPLFPLYLSPSKSFV